ncbi:MAG: hypothetical protein PUC66_01410, partial [Erysipelotrichaceae bacterium]|nr:hypothetical protein [Erysipelotrichaceae bacterium]
IDYWKAPEGLTPEKIPSFNIDKYISKKKRAKGKNETLRASYKRPKIKDNSFLNNVVVLLKNAKK